MSRACARARSARVYPNLQSGRMSEKSSVMVLMKANKCPIIYNHKQALLNTICGNYGRNTTKKQPKKPKKALKSAEWSNFGHKWERKVLETQFWYQKKALHEHNQNKLL